jgi:4-amino-4-deoxy-L-arabinose transferase-like glycosyltransferase
MTQEATAFVATNLLFLAALTTAAWAIGTPLTTRLPTASRLEQHSVAAILGLALLAHLAFFLGLVGWLSPLPFLLATALFSSLFWVRKRTRSQEPGGSPPPGSSSQAPAIPFAGEPDPARSEAQAGAPHPEVHKAPAGSRRRRAAGLLTTALIIVSVSPFFVLALYPPTAFDATTYHLPTARAFAETASLPFLPTLRAPVFPPLSELLSAIALLFAGDVATHLVQLLAAALTAALLAAWGRSAGSPAAGVLAAALFLGNPIVAHLAAIAYVEMLLTLFVAAALFAVDRWRATVHPGWLAAAGFFAGSAAAVKYLGLFFVAWIGVETLLRAGRGRRLRAAALYGALALATLLPAYARITLHTGNPVFPFAAGVFGASAWSAPGVADGSALSRGAADAALLRRYARLPLLPWDLVVERQRTNRQPPLSPLYLLALPALAWGLVRRPRVRRLLLPAAAYAAVFPLLPPDARYLVPALPLVSLGAAEALLPLLERAAPRRRAALAAALAVLCFLPGWLYAGWRVARQGAPPLTAAARERYLARALPAYSALRVLDRRYGDDYTVYALHAENSTYYARGRFLGDWVGSAAFGDVLPLVGDPAALHARLRAMGADHLLLMRGKDYGLGADPAFRRLFLEVYADRHARLFRLAGG